ncbi:YciI family protein [Nocardia sp. CA2R105]|uniref:YciI family protein n=1 Tax=Nocardia coffeae TaxID=2873381 RepID=UPI001CA65258|nr:YciI family protein [Nocardia coffeae]MBY8856774.1 YciI family protein [Nocardia coffeae]
MNFYLVIRRHASPIDDQVRITEHLAWMREQHRRGTVLISGPDSDRTASIYVLRVPSREDAVALADADPLARADPVRIEVIEWDVHQILGIGSFTPPSPWSS